MGLSKAIGQAIFKSLVPEGLPAGAMIKIAQKLGGSYRRTEMLADIRQFTGRVKYEAQIRNLHSDIKVPKAWVVETHLSEPNANYRVFGKANFYDLRTGQVHQQTVSFYHTEHQSKKNYADEFKEYYAGGYEDQDMELTFFEQTALEHNIGKPY